MNAISPTPSPSDLETAAPALVRRLSVILAGLAALVAARFLRNPRLVGLIGPLWRRLSRIAGRVSRAMSRPQVRVRASQAGMRGVVPSAVRLPQGRLWLVRELGWEAAGFGCQLAALLAEPESQAVLGAMPGLGRILRPVCRMLGVVVPVPPVVAVTEVAPVIEVVPVIELVAAPVGAGAFGVKVAKGPTYCSELNTSC